MSRFSMAPVYSTYWRHFVRTLENPITTLVLSVRNCRNGLFASTTSRPVFDGRSVNCARGVSVGQPDGTSVKCGFPRKPLPRKNCDAIGPPDEPDLFETSRRHDVLSFTHHASPSSSRCNEFRPLSRSRSAVTVRQMHLPHTLLAILAAASAGGEPHGILHSIAGRFTA